MQAFLSCVTTGNVKVSLSFFFFFFIMKQWRLLDLSGLCCHIIFPCVLFMSVNIHVTGAMECLSCIEQSLSK